MEELTMFVSLLVLAAGVYGIRRLQLKRDLKIAKQDCERRKRQ